MAQNNFTASIHTRDNLYVATCVEIGTVSQGSTVEDAFGNLKEATSLYLEEFPVTAVAPVYRGGERDNF
ncbi:MAG: type II toxin-antitoxin system HicB family antitoxin [Bacteroidota bacterium]|nr:type II toxin-antitoxin system HicB family antitoxin [Bacteroidota bacterium]